MIGIIGGSGLYSFTDSGDCQTFELSTPFGRPTSPIVKVDKPIPVYFIARHGTNHSFLPSEVNYRANIYALKHLGARIVISFCIVGSLREEIAPSHIVIPDQYIDLTKKRADSFFGEGAVAHNIMAKPLCPKLSDYITIIADKFAQEENIILHKCKTYICIEGPAFSTKAESVLYRDVFRADIIGMTMATEAKLALEAGLRYACICFVTDYDAWRDGSDNLSIENILEIAKLNGERSLRLISRILGSLPKNIDTIASYRNDPKRALITPPDLIPKDTLQRLQSILLFSD